MTKGIEPSDSGFGFDDDDSGFKLPEEKRRRKKLKTKIGSIVEIKLINDLANKCQNNGPQMSLMKS